MSSSFTTAIGALIALQVTLTECAFLERFEGDENPRGLGDLSVADLNGFETKRAQVCGFTQIPAPLTMSGRGTRDYTGFYLLDRNPRTGVREMGKIDVAINFGDNRPVGIDDTAADFFNIVITSITEFPETAPSATNGYIAEPVEQFGDVTWKPENLDGSRKSVVVQITSTLEKTLKTRDGSPGPTSEVTLSFSGNATQQFELGIGELVLCGTTNDQFVDGRFYLEQSS